MTTPEAPIGAKVSVAAGIGYVRWTGSNPGFAAGKWVGVELLEPAGKNDGSVKGERYFDCQPNHGVFVRPSQVKVLEAPKVPATPRTTATRPAATPSSSRLTSTSSVPSRVTSPQKLSSRPGTTPATPPRSVPSSSTIPAVASSTPSTPATSRRPSASAAPTPATRSGSATVFKRPPSVLDRAPTPLSAQPEESEESLSGDVASPPPTRQIVSPAPIGRQVASPTLSSAGDVIRPAQTRTISGTLAPALPIAATPEVRVPSRSPSPDKETAASAFTHRRKLEELRIKVRILENRKHEDQEKIKSLEYRVGEADVLRAARTKLQAKFQELQTSLVAAQRSSRDLQSENAHLETRASEATDQLEMAALDREVAEEKAEAAEAEAARLTERVAELEVEVAVLKEENAEYEKPVSGVEGERSSLAFVQLEKHNERLKEALIRLRDVSAENEREHKVKVAELEKEIMNQEELFGQLELAEAKLGNAEAQVEDLKIQLDDALGAEDMLEQLTERNLQMGERMEEMRVTIVDLEALKELNDELEENHVEAEKQLNEEIESITVKLRDEKQRSTELDSLVLDMEATINQFRELVASLQSEIDALHMQQASQEVESATTSKEAQALMNLNLKLQSTAVKAQSKTVDLELKKLEAAQLAEQLRIVQSYLPEAYHQTEAESTTIYLFFSRISSKVETLINVISQLHGLPGSLHSATSEALVGVCELRGKLRHFAILNRRFASVMRRSPAEEWIKYGKLAGEVAGVESRVDGWLSMVKSDEFNEGDCARDLGSLIAQFDHLSETAFNHPQLDIGEQQLGLAYNFDCDLDNFAAAVGFARHAILSLTAEDDIAVDVGDSSMEEGVYEPVQRILDQVRNVKVPSGKLVAQVEEVIQTSSALLPEVTTVLGDLAISVSNAVDLAVQLAQRIGAHATTIRSTKQPLKLTDIETFLVEITAQSAAPSDVPPWEQIGLFVSRLGNELNAALPKIRTAVKAGQVVLLDTPSPWLARVSAIREAAAYNADTERQVVKLSEELKDMLREVKIRDQNLQEAGVKVETLERRLEALRKQTDIIVELENDVAKAKKQEKVYEEAIEQLQAEQDALEAENARLRKGQAAGDRHTNAIASTPGGGDSLPSTFAATGAGLESSQLAEQVDNLRSAIRYLRSENALLKSKELYNELYSLPALRYRREPDLPRLDKVPSSPISSSEEEDELVTPRSTPTKHSIEVESRLLLKEITRFQSSPKIVDISSYTPAVSGAGSNAGEGTGSGSAWRSRKNDPSLQVWEWKRKEKNLERKLEGLRERAKALNSRRWGNT